MQATYRDKKENLAVMTELMEGAQVVLSEQPLELFEPIQLKGTVDQVLKMKNGLHIALDTKTRNHTTVYAKDIFQLSCYTYLLAHLGFTTASTGIIRFMVPSKRGNVEKLKLVKLYPAEEIESVFLSCRRDQRLVSEGHTFNCHCGFHV